jgi:enoyl-CoA hydratase/carnithine racemase
VAPGIALLRRAGRSWPRRFLAADHLVALADGTAGDPAREVDPAAWALATARATPEDAARIGFVAHVTGNLEAAAAAWSRASASRHPRVAPWAAVALGLLRRRLGDLEGAAAAFEEAIGSGHTDAARRAHTNLRFLPLLPTRPVTDRPLEVLAGDR